jgi:hypothetical protein
MKYQTTELEYAISNPSNPDALGGYTQGEMSGQHSQFNDRVEVDSVLSPTPQIAAISETKDGDDSPPYFKSMMKQIYILNLPRADQNKFYTCRQS